MPNGDMHEYRPLDQQVKDLMTDNSLTREALRKTIALCREMIAENMEIRKLAQLPHKEYPKEIIVDNIHWSVGPK